MKKKKIFEFYIHVLLLLPFWQNSCYDQWRL